MRRHLAGPIVLLLSGTALGQGQLIDLSTWQVVQYEHNQQPDANWVLQNNNTTAHQTVNADPSILLSDFDAAAQEIQGTWRVDTSGDDDFMGFVFGYQDRGQFYLFDWKAASQSFGGGFAEVGMSLKVVQMPPGQDPGLLDLWSTAGTANVTTLAHNTVPWQAFTDYTFLLRFSSGSIEIEVSQGNTLLEQWMIADSTYTNGNFGFYNYSQGDVVYSGFTQQNIPEIYCTAKLNSHGCLPAITSSGTASVSDPNPFMITGSQLINNKFGFLYYGTNGPAATPFQGGFMCVAAPLARVTTDYTFGNPLGGDCSGDLSTDFNAWMQAGNAVGVGAGMQVHAQYIYRDPRNLDGTGFGLTDGVTFPVMP